MSVALGACVGSSWFQRSLPRLPLTTVALASLPSSQLALLTRPSPCSAARVRHHLPRRQGAEGLPAPHGGGAQARPSQRRHAAGKRRGAGYAATRVMRGSKAVAVAQRPSATPCPLHPSRIPDTTPHFPPANRSSSSSTRFPRAPASSCPMAPASTTQWWSTCARSVSAGLGWGKRTGQEGICQGRAARGNAPAHAWPACGLPRAAVTFAGQRAFTAVNRNLPTFSLQTGSMITRRW